MKKFALPILTAVLLSLLACSIGYEGINWGIDEDVEKIYSLTETASAPGYEPITSGSIPVNRVDEPAATSEPVTQPGPSSPAVSTGETGDLVEYSVSAVNNDCTCQTNGNMSISLEIQGDKLIRTLSDGSSLEFEKVSQDRYQRTYMGYYINVDKTGGQEVETRVDEERHDVIILTDTGFIDEHYQGNAASPCCYFTYTRADQAP